MSETPTHATLRFEVRDNRHRHRREGPAAPLQGLQPGRRLDHAPLRRHRPRPRHFQAAG
ncbi:MAG: hypothetical protein WDO13_01260 [Verrucomicrobiota bacterium]